MTTFLITIKITDMEDYDSIHKPHRIEGMVKVKEKRKNEEEFELVWRNSNHKQINLTQMKTIIKVLKGIDKELS